MAENIKRSKPLPLSLTKRMFKTKMTIGKLIRSLIWQGLEANKLHGTEVASEALSEAALKIKSVYDVNNRLGIHLSLFKLELIQ